MRSDEIIDLTAFCKPGGVLDWTPAAGRWTILRFGYTLEGQRTRCSATDQIGYESNMLDRQGIERQFRATADRILELVPGHVGRTLRYVHVDSYELGADVRGQQPTWTAAFRNEFQKRRGYDLLRYLPAMAGRIVDSRERTGRFFWDFRRTIGDLMAQEFFGRLAELAHSRDVGMHAETGYGTYPHPHIDGLECAGKCDVTMGEFWHGTDIMSQFDHFVNSVRSVASAAHVYGRTLIQAEAFTSWNHFAESPATLKAVGDQAFADGLNRMVVHQYTHQPSLTGKPGGQYGAGTHLDRNLTWWDQSRAWLLYLARCQHLLQQGRFHADVAYFYGEGVTRFVPGRDHLRPALPRGYNFDCVNADVLLHRLSGARRPPDAAQRDRLRAAGVARRAPRFSRRAGEAAGIDRERRHRAGAQAAARARTHRLSELRRGSAHSLRRVVGSRRIFRRAIARWARAACSGADRRRKR